jgi:hypothetical protein
MLEIAETESQREPLALGYQEDPEICRESALEAAFSTPKEFIKENAAAGGTQTQGIHLPFYSFYSIVSQRRLLTNDQTKTC